MSGPIGGGITISQQPDLYFHMYTKMSVFAGCLLVLILIFLFACFFWDYCQKRMESGWKKRNMRLHQLYSDLEEPTGDGGTKDESQSNTDHTVAIQLEQRLLEL